MSYSFTVVASTKAEAKQKIADNFDNVVAGQPGHATDKNAAVACGQAFVDMLADPLDDEVINVSIYGSLGWRSDPVEYTSSNISVNASLKAKS